MSATASTEQLYTSVMRGVSARSDLEVVRPKIAERREYLITQAILDFNAKKLDGIGALLFVASLAENRRIIDDLEHEDRQGQRASQKLTS